MQEWKLGCKVNRAFDGIAHIIKQDFQGLFSVWYGAVEITSSQNEWYSLWTKDISLELEDGRIGNARVLSGNSEEISVSIAESEPGEVRMIYVVGLTTLELPRLSAHPPR